VVELSPLDPYARFIFQGLDFSVDHAVEYVEVASGQMARNHATYNATMIKLGETDIRFTLTSNELNIQAKSSVSLHRITLMGRDIVDRLYRCRLSLSLP